MLTVFLAALAGVAVGAILCFCGVAVFLGEFFRF